MKNRFSDKPSRGKTIGNFIVIVVCGLLLVLFIGTVFVSCSHISAI